MSLLITGAKGFVGKNLAAELANRGYTDISEYDADSGAGLLDEYARECAFVFHLAGVNRPRNRNEFMQGNCGFTSVLLDNLKKHNNRAPILATSSIQAGLDNPYGRSKKAAEDLLFSHAEETGAPVYVYRLPNIFGKWCRPDYNSAVATFCHNIANGQPIRVDDPETVMKLVYIDDVVNEFIGVLNGSAKAKNDFCHVEPVYTARLGEIAGLLYAFRNSREDGSVPCLADAFVKNLYSTYLSYLPADRFSYPLKMNVEQRGSFTEFIKTPDRGQISVNISKPGITKGNHWHSTKCEKFLVVSGRGTIRLRRKDSDAVIEYSVSGDKLEAVDIPVGYTHSITNTGDTDLVTIMWANELFDRDRPDTFFLEV